MQSSSSACVPPPSGAASGGAWGTVPGWMAAPGSAGGRVGGLAASLGSAPLAWIVPGVETGAWTGFEAAAGAGGLPPGPFSGRSQLPQPPQPPRNSIITNVARVTFIGSPPVRVWSRSFGCRLSLLWRRWLPLDAHTGHRAWVAVDIAHPHAEHRLPIRERPGVRHQHTELGGGIFFGEGIVAVVLHRAGRFRLDVGFETAGEVVDGVADPLRFRKVGGLEARNTADVRTLLVAHHGAAVSHVAAGLDLEIGPRMRIVRNIREDATCHFRLALARLRLDHNDESRTGK